MASGRIASTLVGVPARTHSHHEAQRAPESEKADTIESAAETANFARR